MKERVTTQLLGFKGSWFKVGKDKDCAFKTSNPSTVNLFNPTNYRKGL